MSNLFYTKEHEWISISGDVATIGITDYAQESLGEIVYVELPEFGKKYESNETVSTVESVKSASDIYSPLAGEIVEINDELDDSPEKVNESAETQGWFFKVRFEGEFDSSEFMNQADYLEMLED